MHRLFSFQSKLLSKSWKSKNDVEDMIGRKVLLIDNNTEFLRLASMVFREAGALVMKAIDGMEGIGKVLTHRPDLIILGTMMSGKNSLQVYKKIRQFSNTPLIMLTTLNLNQLIMQGWEARNGDFLAEPVKPESLLLFARAVMQRSEQVNSYRVSIDYDDGRLKIDTQKHRVLIRNKRVKLTPVEFRLLIYLVSNADKVLAFDQILANVWGSKERNNNYVHVYISHLRNKIEEDSKRPRYIQSIHGVGYIFEKQVTHPSFEKDVGEILTGNKHTLEAVQNEY